MVVADQLPRELTGQYAGETKVKGVRVDVREDSSERSALFIVLVLSDPPKGSDTWPADDLWALRRIVREVKAKVEAKVGAEGLEGPRPEMPWFVVFESKGRELMDAEDIDEQLDVDG